MHSSPISDARETTNGRPSEARNGSQRPPTVATGEVAATQLQTKQADGAKPSLSAIPLRALQTEARAFEFGRLQYSPWNWRSIDVDQSLYVDAALRHILAYAHEEPYDRESGVHHLGHARACLAILLDAEAAGRLKRDIPRCG